MSVETGTSTSTAEIYIPLLNEGVDVVRPTQGRVLGPDEFLILSTPGYDPSDETWAFPPGTRVRCGREVWGGKEILVARQQLD